MDPGIRLASLEPGFVVPLLHFSGPVAWRRRLAHVWLAVGDHDGRALHQTGFAAVNLGLYSEIEGVTAFLV